jgi:Peptidase C13 family
MRRILSNFVRLFANLLAGLRLTLPAPVSRRSFHVSSDQALLLLLVAAAASLVAGYPFGSGPAQFDTDAWAIMGARCLLAMLLYYCVARSQRGPRHFLALAVVLFSSGIAMDFYQALFAALARSYGLASTRGGYVFAGWTVWIILLCWSLAVIARAIRVVYAASWLRTGALTVVVMLGSVAVNWALPPFFWYPAQEADAAEPPQRWIDTEQTYYAQHRLLDAALAALRPARRGVTELYFVGFAGTATQDVFMKEVRSAQQLFDERFGSRGRSLILVNNPSTVEETAVASISNLRQALAGVAAKMNVADDILFLFLTSHGSPHRFSVNFPALALDDLSDRTLKDMLDRSGIKWRILVISACYSGSFIDALKDEHTLILTAAAADKTSFGCSNENDFTYFGDAYINTALRQDRSFVAAFDRAKDIIARREAAENLTPSEPQIYLGAAMKAKLRQVERRLAKQPLAAMAE